MIDGPHIWIRKFLAAPVTAANTSTYLNENSYAEHLSNSATMSKEAPDDKPRLRAEFSDPLTFRHRHPQHWEQKNAEQALSFRDPTHVTFYDRANDVVLHWNSRKQRKGRPPSADTGGDSKWGKRRKMPRLFGVDLKDISW